MITGDAARVTVSVRVTIDDAWQSFTEEMDRWWLRGPAYRISGSKPGVLHLEPRLGGKLIERWSGQERVVGTVTAWEPPRHLVLEWRAVNFVPSETTTVEVWFEGTDGGTLVRLEHRGWAAIRADHPVRHGQASAAFLGGLGMWWGTLLTSFRQSTGSE